MFLMWYRRKIAKEVEEKMLYMGSCPNEMEIILSIIAPKDYSRKGTSLQYRLLEHKVSVLLR